MASRSLFPHLFGNLLLPLWLETTVLCLVSSPPQHRIPRPRRGRGRGSCAFKLSRPDKQSEFILKRPELWRTAHRAREREKSDQATLVEQVKRVKEIEAIESDSFVPQTFRSSKEVKKSTEPTELQYEPVTIGVGTVDASAPEKEPPPANIPTAIKYQDDNSLAHPNLFIEKAEADEKWFQRLIALRQERLMGSPVA
ncbi:PREDICTED: serine/Arginine-related protein 53-like [Cariama cristata]|uniref:serine/Arginine-related protein 53-like n=1 Tax=Cariama cristata TaxID=54380 RepID=UPI000520F01C|nr:PREDICTED: serine/Arginine-related protein 53-like [Cariama cristata]